MAGWDVHTHLVPPTVLSAVSDGEHGLSVSDGTLAVDGARLPLRRLASPAALLDWVAAQGLDGAVVSVPPPLFRYDLGGAWADLVNQGLLELADRFRVLGHVPLGSPQLAADVAAKLISGGGFSGVALGTLTTSPGFASPELDPLWQVLDEAGAFVLLHPGHCPDPRLEPYYLTNLLGNPYETALAVAGLIFGDVLGRFPGIRFCLCHGGGATAAVVGRWQRGVDTSRPGIGPVGLPPRDALRRLYVDDLVHDPGMLRLVLDTFGEDRVLAGSDWPFPMGSDQVDISRAERAERLTRPL